MLIENYKTINRLRKYVITDTFLPHNVFCALFKNNHTPTTKDNLDQYDLSDPIEFHKKLWEKETNEKIVYRYPEITFLDQIQPVYGYVVYEKQSFDTNSTNILWSEKFPHPFQSFGPFQVTLVPKIEWY